MLPSPTLDPATGRDGPEGGILVEDPYPTLPYDQVAKAQHRFGDADGSSPTNKAILRARKIGRGSSLGDLAVEGGESGAHFDVNKVAARGTLQRLRHPNKLQKNLTEPSLMKLVSPVPEEEEAKSANKPDDDGESIVNKWNSLI